MAQYDHLVEHYINRRKDTTRFDYNRDIEVPAMLKMIGNPKGKTILDMGCGFGDQVKELSKKGAKRVIGFDIAKGFIDYAKDQNIPRAEFYLHNMSKKLPHKDSQFDIVFSSLAIHYISNLNKLFKEVRRVLKKGGIWIFSTGHPIFNMIIQSPNSKIEIKRVRGKRVIDVDYFDQKPRPSDLGSLGRVTLYAYTFETLIKSGLKNGFELIDYKDAFPVKRSQKYEPGKYYMTSKLPTFIFFKFKKK